MTAVTQKEYAALRGVSKQMISKLKRDQRLVMTPDGLVDVDASNTMIEKTAHPGYTNRMPPMTEPERDTQPDPETIPAVGTYTEARARNEMAKAEIAEMERDLMRGDLVRADEARRFAADLGAIFRTALETLPDRISAELVPLTDIEAVRALLVENFEDILTNVANRIDKGIA